MEQLDRSFPSFIFLFSHFSSYLVIRFAVTYNFTSPFNIFESEICPAPTWQLRYEFFEFNEIFGFLSKL